MAFRPEGKIREILADLPSVGSEHELGWRNDPQLGLVDKDGREIVVPRIAIELHYRRVAPPAVLVEYLDPDTGAVIHSQVLEPINVGVWITLPIPASVWDRGQLPRIRLLRVATPMSKGPRVQLLINDSEAQQSLAMFATPGISFMAAISQLTQGYQMGQAFFLHLDLVSTTHIVKIDGTVVTEVADYLAGLTPPASKLDPVEMRLVQDGLLDTLDTFVRAPTRPANTNISSVAPAEFANVVGVIEALLAFRFSIASLAAAEPSELQRRRLIIDFSGFASGLFAIEGSPFDLFNCEPNGPFFFLFCSLALAATQSLDDEIDGLGAPTTALENRREWWRTFLLATTAALEPYVDIYSSAAWKRDTTRYGPEYRDTALGMIAWSPGRCALYGSGLATATPSHDSVLDLVHSRLRFYLSDELTQSPKVDLDSDMSVNKMHLKDRYKEPQPNPLSPI